MSPGAIIVTPSPTQTPKMIFITKQKQELKIVKVIFLNAKLTTILLFEFQKELFQERCHSEDMESLLHDSEEIRNVYGKYFTCDS